MADTFSKHCAFPCAAARRYAVRPARPSDGEWSGPDTPSYYLTIVRLADRATCQTWKANDWRDADSWAHSQWESWHRAGWHPQAGGQHHV